MTARAVVFMRHGAYHQQADTPSAWQPHPLTDEGRQQAIDGAKELLHMLRAAELPLPGQLFCSGLLRAWQTAQIIATELSPEAPLPIIADKRLNERCVGSFANLTVEQIQAAIAADPRHAKLPADWKSNSAYRLPCPGAESLREAGERVSTCIQQVQQQHDPRPVDVFIGHGAAFRHAAAIMGLLDQDRIAAVSMYHARPILFVPDDHGHWHRQAGHWKPRTALQTQTD